MGQRLGIRHILPDVMISSPAKRAFSTARMIAKEISFPLEDIQKEPMFYHGSTSNMTSILQNVSKDVDTLMIFGHNPGLTDLANHLAGSDIYNIPTCGIAEIEFDVSSWDEVGKDSGNLVSFDYPKKVV